MTASLAHLKCPYCGNQAWIPRKSFEYPDFSDPERISGDADWICTVCGESGGMSYIATYDGVCLMDGDGNELDNGYFSSNRKPAARKTPAKRAAPKKTTAARKPAARRKTTGARR